MISALRIKRTYKTLIAVLLLAATVLSIAAKGSGGRYLVKEEKFVSKGKVSATILYNYDSLGRVIMTRDDTFAMRLIYRGDTVYQNGRYRGMPYGKIKFILGPDGVAKADNSGKVYMYNADGYMTAAIYPNGSFQSMTIENGDVVQTTTNIGNSRSSTICTFYEEEDKKDLGQVIFGKRDKHLIKMLIATQGDRSDTLRYTHVLDRLGRVTSETYVGPRMEDTTTIYSTYYERK